MPLTSTSIGTHDTCLLDSFYFLVPRMAAQVHTEENLKVRSKSREDSDDEDNAHVDPQLGFVQPRRRKLTGSAQ